MNKSALVPIADGSEELESIAVVDILRRAGTTVTLASVGSLQVTGSKGIQIGADRLIGECLGEIFDVVVLPGGMPGAGHLRDCGPLIDYIRRHNDEGRLLAAICAAPVVILHHHNLLKGRNFTCHPFLTQLLGATKTADSPVVVDGKLITSRGAGTALQFSLKLVEILYDKQKVRDVAAGMALPLSQMMYL
ncbi:MAG: Chaperone protein YajL [Syntrophorhabdus sp. PtaU1.Bin002]|nr:MAG: Chaperone protein YajL [Syntrophorhabdus sp. PtaB.Bin006]OPY65171.1 MAG: Chaperone protein YajL [Syntrophorhabdus sp. PtaU1.Bin002]